MKKLTDESKHLAARPVGITHKAWEDHTDWIAMTPPHPFRLSETIGYLTRSANECLYHVENGKIYRMIQVADECVIIEISGSDSALELRFLSEERPPKTVRSVIADYVWEWFDFDRDLSLFYRQMEECPLLNKLVQKYYGLRVIGVPDLFEALCWAIIGQQINLTFAYTLKRRLVESFGEHQVWKDREYWLFPKPEIIAQLEVNDLLKLQFTGKKSEYLIDVAKRMNEGRLTKAGLLKLGDFQAAERVLVQIRGIGPWTANYVLMRCLRSPSAFPIEDVGLQNAVKENLGLNRKPTLAELREMALKWSGWEAYATFYLWHSLFQTIA